MAKTKQGEAGRWSWFVLGSMGHPMLRTLAGERYCEIHLFKGERFYQVSLDAGAGDCEPDEGTWDEEHAIATDMLTDVQASTAFCAARAGAPDLDGLMMAVEALYRAVMS